MRHAEVKKLPAYSAEFGILQRRRSGHTLLEPALRLVIDSARAGQSHCFEQVVQVEGCRCETVLLDMVSKAPKQEPAFAVAPKSSEPRRGPIPKVRARNRTLLKAMLARYAVFWAEYREALESWRGGNRGVVFPFGTWAMRVFHSAAVGLG